MNRRMASWLLVLWMLVAMTITACAPAAMPAPAAPAEPTAAPAEPTKAPEPMAVPEPAGADEPTQFVFAHTGPIRTMDAPVTWFGSTHWLTNLLYDCLIWRDADGSGYVGQAAEKWENIDPKTWRFHLRPGITFHNGEPLDANAVKWNLDRVMTREDFLVQPQWQFIDQVKVIDDATIEITADEPHAYFEYDVSYNGCELLPPKYMEEVGEEEFAKRPVGSGPYKLTDLVLNEKYVFEAWDGYWGGKPEVDRVVYQVIPEPASQIAALLAGQVDFVYNIPIPDRERLASALGVKILRGPSNQQHLLYARFEDTSGKMPENYPGYKPTTLDKRIRQAVSYALDRTLLGEIQGTGRPSLLRVDSYDVDHVGQYAGEDTAANYYNPERAKQLIKEAGFDPDSGKKPLVHLDSPNQYSGNEKEVAEAIKAMLEDVGFQVEMNILDRAAYYEQIIDVGNWRELALIPIGGSGSLIPLFYNCDWSEPGFDSCQLVKGDWDTLSRQILKEVDPEARKKLWENFWDYYVDEGAEITLYFMDRVMAMNDKFDWTPRADGWFTFRDLKLAK